jgi:hypothetical protein
MVLYVSSFLNSSGDKDAYKNEQSIVKFRTNDKSQNQPSQRGNAQSSVLN